MSPTANGLAEIVERHDAVLFRSNGKPGLCTRMQQAEDRMDAHSERMDGHEESLKDVRKMFWTIVLLLLTLFGGVITNIVLSHTGDHHALISDKPPVIASYDAESR